ncbi:MAG: hypothetical protein JWM28_674, partial [Chitinophagaceae bacterium]|nr:hypothetical protein [Chitinophagaceae bacterium]
MKKLLIAAIAFLGISAASFAQTPAAPKDTKAKTAVKQTDAKAKVATTAVKSPAAKTAATTKDATATKVNAATPVKKDGTPDKRFKANKDATKTAHLKKDGTPDKRFKESK